MRKAAAAVMQTGVAEPSREVYEALERLHPKRDRHVALPVCPAEAHDLVVISEQLLVSVVHGYRGAAAGPSNWTADLLAPLLDDNALRQSFVAISTDIANGMFDGSPVGDRLLACALVGLVKDDATGKLRPVAMGELFLKVAAAAVMRTEADTIAEIFAAIQFGVGRSGGSESASIVANTALATDTKVGMVLLDQGNAFNQIPRELVLRQLYARPQLRRLWRIANFAYGVSSPLLMYNRNGDLVSDKVFASEQGVRQGCALGGLLYANAVQALYAEALAAAGEGLMGLVAVMDDVAVVGHLGAVRRFVAAFKAGSAARGLELNLDKCVVLQPQDNSVAPEWLQFARDNGFQRPQVGAAQWLGTAVGWERAAMKRIIMELNGGQHSKLFAAVSSAEMGAQNALLVLRASILPRATYALRTASPLLVEAFARQFDDGVANALAAIVKRKPSAKGASVFGPAGDAYRLSLSRGGVGLRAAETLSAAAYVSAVAVAISHMTDAQRAVLKRDDNVMNLGLRMATTKLRICVPNFLFAPPANPKQPVSAKECVSTVQFVDHYTQITAIGLPVQRLITAALDKHKYTLLCDDSAVKARLQSAGDANAYSWLTTPPSEPQFRLADTEVVRALRHRMGMAPVDTAPVCACGVAVTDYNFDHFHSCDRVKTDATRARHNVVQQALAVVATEAGVTTRMDYGSSSAKEHNGSRLNPDGILFGLHSTGADVVTDVAVVNPTSASRVARASHAIRKLATADSEEGFKRNKYRDYVSQNRSVFCAFVAESYGAFGVSMKWIIAQLVKRAAERSVPSALDLQAFSFSQWANRVLSASIQRGNSRVVDLAMERERRRLQRV
jgi:Reverse transcriptase (RNA-dependent DNA polymerase)